MDSKVLHVTHKTDIYLLPFPPIKENSLEKIEFVQNLRRELANSQHEEQKELKKSNSVCGRSVTEKTRGGRAPSAPYLCHNASPSIINHRSATDKSDVPRLIQPHVCFGAETVWITATVTEDEQQTGPSSERLGEQKDWWKPKECQKPQVFDFKLGKYVPWVGPLPEAIVGEGWDKRRKQHVLRLRWPDKTTTVTTYAKVEGLRDDVWQQKLEDHYDCYTKILDIIRPAKLAQPYLVWVEWHKDNYVANNWVPYEVINRWRQDLLLQHIQEDRYREGAGTIAAGTSYSGNIGGGNQILSFECTLCQFIAENEQDALKHSEVHKDQL